MATGDSQSEILRSALFVDFDNVFIGLQESSPRAAEVFGRLPEAWLDWLARVGGRRPTELGEPAAPPAVRRALLTRNCYLNPVQDTKGFRAFFTRAGFHVVDCPSLTQQGKSSADIHMVMDILDILAHPVHYDEVIVMSADADFTAVMLRLRSHDRRTMSVSSSPVAQAFRAACDVVVSDEEFTTQLLGLQRSISTVTRNTGVEAVLTSATDLPEDMAELVVDMVLKSPKPVPHAMIAGRFTRQYGRPQTVEGQWFGYGSFGEVLRSLSLAVDGTPLLVDFEPPGYVLDPNRHTRPAPAPDTLDRLAPELAAFIRTVHSTTGLPPLAPETYRQLFEQIHLEAQDIRTAGRLYSVQSAAEAIAQRCSEIGVEVTVKQAKFILIGYELSRFWAAGPEPATPEQLAAATRDSTVVRWRHLGIPDSEENRTLLDRWLLGIEPDAAEPEPREPDPDTRSADPGGAGQVEVGGDGQDELAV